MERRTNDSQPTTAATVPAQKLIKAQQKLVMPSSTEIHQASAKLGLFNEILNGMSNTLIKAVVVSVTFAIVISFGWIWAATQSWTWQQRLTVTLNISGEERSFSGVYGVTLEHTQGPLIPSEATGASQIIQGEALTIEAQPGKYIFVLLKGMPSTLDLLVPTGLPADRILALSEKKAVPITLTPDRYPILVSFHSLSQPDSVMRVTPENMATTVGHGISVVSITLSVTDEPVSSGHIDELLPWLDRYQGKMLDGFSNRSLRSKNAFANSLSANAFKWGI